MNQKQLQKLYFIGGIFMKTKEFKPYSLMSACKKFRYPFSPAQVETTSAFKGNIDAEATAASYNLTFLLIHGIFWLCWYCLVLGCYCYYFIGYTIWWGVSTIIENSKNSNNNLTSDTVSENDDDNTNNEDLDLSINSEEINASSEI